MQKTLTTCALVAASDFNAEHFENHYHRGAFDRIIAIDAGYAHLCRRGIPADRVIGDFDSLGFVPDGDNVEVHPAHKSKSDLEIGFDEVLSAGFTQATVYGALGGRLDHTVANLQMCAGFAERGIAITLVALDFAIRILVGPGRLELPSRDHGTVSVFSATDMAYDVTEAGLEYPLDHAQLANRTTLGLSNEFIGESVVISVERGTLYVFYPIDE